MKKVYRLQNLDCANCAAKMERAAEKVDGVDSVRINFLSQKLSLEAEEAKFEEVLREVENVCRKVEPDCKIVR